MIAVTLPDGSKREFESAVTVADVAASIGAGLAKAALAGKVWKSCAIPLRICWPRPRSACFRIPRSPSVR
jgi:hypothetical protein